MILKPLSNSEAASRLLEKRRIVSNSPLKKILEERSKEVPLAYMPKVSVAEMAAIKRGRAARPERVGPTPERLAKGDLRVDIDPVDGRRYKPKESLVEKYHGKWKDEVEVAFMEFVADSQAGDVKGVIINYNGAGGSSVGTRLGGLGNAKAAELERLHRFHFIMDRLPSRARRVAEFILIPRATVDRALTLEEIGRYVFPHFKDPRSLQMLGLGYVVALGDKLVDLYAAWNVETRVMEVRQANMRTINGGTNAG